MNQLLPAPYKKGLLTLIVGICVSMTAYAQSGSTAVEIASQMTIWLESRKFPGGTGG